MDEISNTDYVITRHGMPIGYRLAMKQDGELILQGLFKYEHSGSCPLHFGHEWEDIETVWYGEDDATQAQPE